jgi:hypothetical protein
MDLALDTEQWHGSVVGSECTFHQIAPYIGKMKSSMARQLIEQYCSKGDLVLDPFAGSGAIGLEALLAGRSVICADRNPYAITLTEAKIIAPSTLEEAIQRAQLAIDRLSTNHEHFGRPIPDWVTSFFHPDTLKETIAFSKIVQDSNDSFLMACLLGIMHHQRPGFLSYPSSHLVPYLRTKKFPKKDFPSLYEYRDLRPRLISKIKRTYRRPPDVDSNLTRKCIKADVRDLCLAPGSVDAVITSPPYMDALDYARDNRLRLWFLGIENYKRYDAEFKSLHSFSQLMHEFLDNASLWLRKSGRCVCVVGEVNRANTSIDIARLIANIAVNKVGTFKLESIVTDSIPDVRRARKGSYVKTESIVSLVNERV